MVKIKNQSKPIKTQTKTSQKTTQSFINASSNTIHTYTTINQSNSFIRHSHDWITRSNEWIINIKQKQQRLRLLENEGSINTQSKISQKDTQSFINVSSSTIRTQQSIRLLHYGSSMVKIVIVIIIIIIIIVEMTVAVKLWETLLVESKKTNGKSRLPVTDWNFHRWVSNNVIYSRRII